MQIMPRTSSIALNIPALLEEIFKRYSCDEERTNIGELFVELNSLLGARVVKAALHLLDYRTIVVYRNPLRTREIAEIREGNFNSSHIVRLFPRVNYCTCDCFQHQVLNSEKNSESPYTCEHVLAVRLALLMKSETLRFEELPSNKINLMLPHFLPGDDTDEC